MITLTLLATLPGTLSGVATLYLFLNASLSMTPGEVLDPDDPMSAPFTLTNTSQFWKFRDGTLVCQINQARLRNQPSFDFSNNVVATALSIRELGPNDGQETVYCAGGRKVFDFGPIESADVTIMFLYNFPYHLPCHGMRWQRYETVSAKDGKLRWVPIVLDDSPASTEMVLRRHFYCGPSRGTPHNPFSTQVRGSNGPANYAQRIASGLQAYRRFLHCCGKGGNQSPCS